MSGKPVTGADGGRALGRVEFIGLMAMMMSVAALSVDLMLPAFADIRRDFGMAPDSTAVAGLVTAFMIGLAASQLVFGVLADRFGRKPIIYVSLGVYLIGALASVFAPSFGFLLGARFVWGLGAAGPRVLTLSIVRDTHEGAEMARIMSFIMAVFVLVPVVAPTIGAALTGWTSWRGAFLFVVVVAVAVALWSLRLPETLAPANRREIGAKSILGAAKFVVTNRVTTMITLALTVLFGAFLSYLASSEIIFTEVFDQGENYPLIFGGVAAMMGVGMLANSWLVGRFGLRQLINFVIVAYVIAGTVLAVIGVTSAGRPPLWMFVGGLASLVLFQSLLIPNLNTVAMVPMGSVAGVASAIIGTVSTGLAAVIGALIDRTFDGTVLPITVALAIASWVSMALVKMARIEADSDARRSRLGSMTVPRPLPEKP